VQQYNFGQFTVDVYFLNKNIGIASSYRFMKTTDGGFSWTPSQSSAIGEKLEFKRDSVGWAGIENFWVTKTTDEGTTWFYQTSPIYNNGSVSASDTLKAWAGGSGIVHTTDGGGPPVAVNPISNEIPASFYLFQNYPNPFNPKTKIRYQLQKSGHVRLIVFDIKGKEVSELINQKQNAGVYETDFDGGSLASGVYFYQLTISSEGVLTDNEQSAEIFTETKKMILIK